MHKFRWVIIPLLAAALLLLAGDLMHDTFDTAYAAGSNPSPLAATSPAGTPDVPATSAQFVLTVTPSTDGSLVHVVEAGQALITIAQAYGVTVNEIKALNGLTSDAIYVGDRLLIRAANTPAPSATATSTSTPTRAATITRVPTRTVTAAPILPSPTPIPAAAAEETPDRVGGILIGVVIVLAVGGLGLMALGGYLKSRPAG